GIDKADLVEPAKRCACLVVQVLIGELPRFRHMPRTGKEVGRPAPVPEHLKGRVEAHAYGRLRTLTNTVKGFLLAPGSQTEVIAYCLGFFRAFPKDPIRT